jgi:hypothetical protein
MSDLYSSLNVSPRKKRALPDSDDETVLTPKRIRTLYVRLQIVPSVSLTHPKDRRHLLRQGSVEQRTSRARRSSHTCRPTSRVYTTRTQPFSTRSPTRSLPAPSHPRLRLGSFSPS